MIVDLKEYNKLFIIRTYTELLYIYIFCCFFFQTGLKRCQYNHDNRIPIQLMKLKNISYDVHNIYVKVSCVICSNTFCTQLPTILRQHHYPSRYLPQGFGKLYYLRNLLQDVRKSKQIFPKFFFPMAYRYCYHWHNVNYALDFRMVIHGYTRFTWL